MLLHKANKVEVFDGQVGTTATEIHAGGDGTMQYTVINDDGVDTLYVGWDNTVSSTVTTHFIGGDLAAGASIVLSNFTGPLWLEGSAAGVDYRVERRYDARG